VYVEDLLAADKLVAGTWVGVAQLPRLLQALFEGVGQELVLEERLQDAENNMLNFNT
jgi:hypothetical protein